MVGFSLMVFMVLIGHTQNMVLPRRLSDKDKISPLYGNRRILGSFSGVDNSKTFHQRHRRRENGGLVHRLLGKETNPRSVIQRELINDFNFTISKPVKENHIKHEQKELILKQFDKVFDNTENLALVSDTHKHSYLQQISGEFKKTFELTSDSAKGQTFRDSVDPNLTDGGAREKRGFCRLLCASCEDMASRRWSILCGSQCESGGTAYNICLMVYRNIDGSSRPI